MDCTEFILLADAIVADFSVTVADLTWLAGFKEYLRLGLDSFLETY